MKPAKRLVLMSLAVIVGAPSIALSQHAHSHVHTPLHGGVVVEASDVDFELVATPRTITLYLRDHGKPIDVKGASGKIILLSGADKFEATLSPVDGNALQATGTFKVAPGTKAVSTVGLPGRKPITARFVIK